MSFFFLILNICRKEFLLLQYNYGFCEPYLICTGRSFKPGGIFQSDVQSEYTFHVYFFWRNTTTEGRIPTETADFSLQKTTEGFHYFWCWLKFPDVAVIYSTLIYTPACFRNQKKRSFSCIFRIDSAVLFRLSVWKTMYKCKITYPDCIIRYSDFSKHIVFFIGLLLKIFCYF